MPSASAQRRAGRVLVVDDNVDAAQRPGAAAAGRTGFEVVAAHDGPAALAAADGRPAPTSSCSTSACPTWTATRSPAASEPCPTLTDALIVAVSGYGRDREAPRRRRRSITTWSSPSTSTPCSRSWRGGGT